jgi:hypothetical protein
VNPPPQAPDPSEVTSTRITEWRESGYPYKLVAAEIAEWALKHERGTPVPGNEHFAANLSVTPSAATWKRARTFLAQLGVIRLNSGPDKVA